MMVVLSIFTIMTGVVLANLPQFRERTALQLVAQKMSLTIREAQVYGVGVKSSSVTVFPSHGINFGDLDIAGNKKSYILFADIYPASPTIGNNNYDSSPIGEIVTKYDLTGTVEIQSISTCNPPGNPADCTSRDSGLNIVFDRPKTEANFTDTSSGNAITPSASYARITIKSSRSNDQRFIDVWNTGQISVKIPPPLP